MEDKFEVVESKMKSEEAQKFADYCMCLIMYWPQHNKRVKFKCFQTQIQMFRQQKSNHHVPSMLHSVLITSTIALLQEYHGDTTFCRVYNF